MRFKKILTDGCIFYTVLMTLFYAIGLLASSSAQWVPTARSTFSLLGFSMVLAVVNALVKMPPLPFSGKLGIHFAATAVLYYLIFVLGGGFGGSAGGTVAAMLIFLAIYALCLLVVAIVRWLLKDELTDKVSKKGSIGKKEEDDYQSMFKK